jgi:hypothetical protein
LTTIGEGALGRLKLSGLVKSFLRLLGVRFSSLWEDWLKLEAALESLRKRLEKPRGRLACSSEDADELLEIEVEVNAETKGPVGTTSADGFLTWVGAFCGVTWSPGMGDPSWSKLPIEEASVNLVELLEQLSYCIGRLTPSPRIPAKFLLEQTSANLG